MSAGDVAYDKNVPITVSVREHSRAVVQPPAGADAAQRPVFMLMIVNTSDHPITIGPENVVASAGGQPLAVITSEQLEREARRQAFWIRFGAAMQAANLANLVPLKLMPVPPLMRWLGSRELPRGRSPT